MKSIAILRKRKASKANGGKTDILFAIVNTLPELNKPFNDDENGEAVYLSYAELDDNYFNQATKPVYSFSVEKYGIPVYYRYIKKYTKSGKEMEVFFALIENAPNDGIEIEE